MSTCLMTSMDDEKTFCMSLVTFANMLRFAAAAHELMDAMITRNPKLTDRFHTACREYQDFEMDGNLDIQGLEADQVGAVLYGIADDIELRYINAEIKNGKLYLRKRLE